MGKIKISSRLLCKTSRHLSEVKRDVRLQEFFQYKFSSLFDECGDNEERKSISLIKLATLLQPYFQPHKICWYTEATDIYIDNNEAFYNTPLPKFGTFVYFTESFCHSFTGPHGTYAIFYKYMYRVHPITWNNGTRKSSSKTLHSPWAKVHQNSCQGHHHDKWQQRTTGQAILW